MSDKITDGWQIDRRVPLATVLVLLANFCALSWWGATTDARLNALEKQQATAHVETIELRNTNQQVQTSLAIIQSRVVGISRVLEAKAGHPLID